MKIKDLPGALTPESERGPDRAPPTRRRRAYFLVKRIQDILLSVFALAALAPVLLAIALAVVIDDPKGGPIFSQVRCGRRGKPFRLYKFRSMCVDAEKRLEELLPYNEMSGPAFKIQHDPRITRLGRFLRSTGLDELPQMVNILKGDMSIVGPRPPLPREVEEYTAHQRQRLTVTPGLTCFWQVSPNRNSLSFDTWVCLTPFLSFFMKEIPKDIPHIPLIYVLNLVNASISYFFSYKSTLLFVHQQKYVETAIRAAVSLAAVGAQIGVLLLTRNYLYYLFLAIAATVVQNAAVSLQADRLYPYLREKDIRPLPEEALGEIRRNVRAMLLHRIGAVAVFNTDNLLISKFAGVASAGLYSNYTMIRGFLNILVSALFDAITPALGNLTATEPEESKRTAFRRLSFFSAWLFGWMSICLFCLYDPFIDLWLGEGYLLSKPAVLLIAVNFYVNGMRTPVNNTKSVLGLFWDDRYKSIVEAACNLAVSVLLARRWGVAGIMAGTLTYLLCGMTGSGWTGFLGKGLLCAAAPNAVYLAAYRKTEEFRFLKGTAGRLMKRAR